jgi:hypothetical protein
MKTAYQTVKGSELDELDIFNLLDKKKIKYS